MGRRPPLPAAGASDVKTQTVLISAICLVLAVTGVLGWPLTIAMSLLLAYGTNDASDQLTNQGTN